MRDLAAHLRHLFVVQTLGDVPESFASPPSTPTAWKRRPSGSPRPRSLRAIDLLAAAISAVKDGSDPRIQLEIALLKATQPQFDGSLQALMARVERLEQSAGGRAPARPEPQTPPEVAPQPERRTEPEAAAPEPPRAAATPPERAAARAEAAATASVASTAVVEPESQPQPDPAAAPPLDLEQLRTLWPRPWRPCARRTGWWAPCWRTRVPSSWRASA